MESTPTTRSWSIRPDSIEDGMKVRLAPPPSGKNKTAPAS